MLIRKDKEKNMYQTITFSQFCDSFSGDRQNQFSYKGKKALFDYLKQYEEETGEEIELDVIALCCDYTEHETALDAAVNYSTFLNEEELKELDEEEKEKKALDFLRERTQVIEFDGGIIIQEF